ncbi:Gfo/Idh/MocA family oxidoreductase [Mesorhizobium sp.]|uniref:Gfo/Idh/MocA family protein n=1 Tax=Mesorhizobium sp. TaxID=1871066 RepID=UPI0025D9283E|nr:Gfo/Idh/MocA family oxidoreductase [Mesorhizobium sp.]
MTRLRFAVLGTGAIVRKAHLPALRADSRVDVAVLMGRDIDRTNALAREFAIPTVAQSLDEVFSDGRIDAVVVALPNFLHRQAADAAIQAGVHILMEKPLAASIFDARAMVASAREAGISFAVNLPQRFRPSMIQMKEAIANRAIGSIESIEIRLVRRSGIPGYGTWFTRRALSGGGVLADLGPHVIDLALWLAGDPSAEVETSHIWGSHGSRGKGLGDWTASQVVSEPALQFDVEDRARFSLTAASGALINGEVAWAYAGADENRVSVVGSHGGFDYFPEAQDAEWPLVFVDSSLHATRLPVKADHADLTPAWMRCTADFVDGIVTNRPADGQAALSVEELIRQLYAQHPAFADR